MLNLLGSHDTARPMTVVHRRDQGSHALESLKLMAAMQFTCTGAPCIYYGDEIGMEGDKDPIAAAVIRGIGSSGSRKAVSGPSCWPITKSSSPSGKTTRPSATACSAPWRRTPTANSTPSSATAPTTTASSP